MICDRCRRPVLNMQDARGWHLVRAEEFDRGRALAAALRRRERPPDPPGWWLCGKCYGQDLTEFMTGGAVSEVRKMREDRPDAHVYAEAQAGRLDEG